MRHLIDVFDLSPGEIAHIFALAEDLKTRCQGGLREPLLPGRVMGLLFAKPSLRTRVSFEAAMVHLGGSSLYLGDDVGWGKRESTRDFARALSQYVDVIVCRAGDHAQVGELAQHSQCPVINGLTSLAHPCQALADLFTLRELEGDLQGRTLAYVGDGNNVARSLAAACSLLGVRFACAAPPGYELDDQFLRGIRAEVPQAEIEITADPAQAVQDAMAVYTDVWSSMGQEAEEAQRRRAFARYQVNAALLAHAPPDAHFMHCLPARRGQEVADEVIDGPRSIVFHQAANRMHVQKGILAWLLTHPA